MSASILNITVLVLSLLLALVFFLFIIPKRKKKSETISDGTQQSSGTSIVLWLLVIPGLIFFAVNYFLPLPNILHAVLAYALIALLALNLISLSFNLPKKIKNEGISSALIISVFIPIIIAVITIFSAAGHTLLAKSPEPVVAPPPPKKVLVEQFPSNQIASIGQAIKKRIEERFDSLNQSKHFPFPIQPIINFNKKTNGDSTLNISVEYAYEVAPKEALWAISSSDFNGGAFKLEDSKVLTEMAQNIRHHIQNELKRYIEQSDKVNIKISGYTDAGRVLGLRYQGELGVIPKDTLNPQPNEMKYYHLNDKQTPLRLQHWDKIDNNELGFLRAYSVKLYLENQNPTLKKANTNYDIYSYTQTNPAKAGAKFRKVRTSINIKGVKNWVPQVE